jgi:serine/threonine protein kinase
MPRVFENCSGYMAPEYAQHGIFSVKSDVFSYGVVVLEIITGRRNTCTQGSRPSQNLLTYVRINLLRKSL